MNDGPNRPRRFVVFGASMLGDWNNPAAAPLRGLVQALTTLGHEATFMEPRNAPLFLETLRRHRYAAPRAFAAEYPSLRYRTYELPRTRGERAIWIGQELATADAVIVHESTPAVAQALVGELAVPRLVRVVWRGAATDPSVSAELVMLADSRRGNGDDELPRLTPLPAASTARLADDDRDGVLLVAYGRADDARRAAATVRRRLQLVRAGPDGPEEWPAMSESVLPSLYRKAQVVVLFDGSADPFAIGRRLLPRVCNSRLVLPSDEDEGPASGLEGCDRADVNDLPDLLDAVIEAGPVSRDLSGLAEREVDAAMIRRLFPTSAEHAASATTEQAE